MGVQAAPGSVDASEPAAYSGRWRRSPPSQISRLHEPRATHNVPEWRSLYESRTVSAEEAVSAIKDGDRVAFTSGNEPTALSLALLARADDLRGVTLFLPTPSRDLGWYDPGFEESFEIEIGYILPVVRDMVAERRCDYTVQTLLVEYGPLDEAPDVALVEVSPPDESGYCSFGASLWNKREQIEDGAAGPGRGQRPAHPHRR